MSDLSNGRNEQTVKTTIVGSRPPGRGREHEIPHGIEVLIKKAAVDVSFRQVLLERRAEAAREIGLELTPAEIAMLDSAPAAQIEAIIENTKVPDAQHRTFLGRIAARMLAAIATRCGCRACRRIRDNDPEDDSDQLPAPTGIRPDLPDPDHVTRGSRPDLPAPTPVSKGIQPDLPPPTSMGIRPDSPIPPPTPTLEDVQPDQTREETTCQPISPSST